MRFSPSRIDVASLPHRHWAGLSIFPILSVPDTLSIVNTSEAPPFDRTGEQVAPPEVETVAERDGRDARWIGHRAERRQELLRAARKAIHRIGPEAAMDDIASSAGTSKSVFYRYFGDRSGLRAAMGDELLDVMQQRIAQAQRSAQNPRSQLHHMVMAYLSTAQTSPNVYVFVTTGHDSLASATTLGLDNEDASLTGFLSAVSELITTSMSADGPSTSGFSALYWPGAALGLVRAAGEAWLGSDPDKRPSADDMATLITTWLLDGANHASGTQ